MKKLILPLFAVLAIVSCRKTAGAEETSSLKVEKQNLSVIAIRTATWCAPCGSFGFPKFAQKQIDYNQKAVFMAWKDALSEAHNGGAEGDHLFTVVAPQFKLGGSVPTFFTNFIKEGNDATLVSEHNSSEVVVNSNYSFEKSGNLITLKTTTKFFKNVEGRYLMAPYLIVNDIKGYQNGHPDTPNTLHHSYVAGIAKPIGDNTSKSDFGYEIANGNTKEGHSVSLEFTQEVDPSWGKHQLSFGLIIFKDQGDSLAFVNAYTKFQ